MTPYSYELKAIVARQQDKFWRSAALTDLPAAPVYQFLDQDQFDSDPVWDLVVQRHDQPLCLPHNEVLFELPHWDPRIAARVAYIRRVGDLVEGYLFYRMRDGSKWGDIHACAEFTDHGAVEIEFNSRFDSAEHANPHAAVLAHLVWRGVNLLAASAQTRDVPFPVTRRPKLARAGVSGWIFRTVNIDLAQVRAATPRGGGSHASPRWHIRRGHWRGLPDGRRVFVRACEVGDVARGGVVKDYRITTGAAS
ncbi:MAG: hypothetical protein ACK4JB_05435 [Reyranella sp.]